jgi:drug/metabolite transporter (DMT)-like permease
VSQSALLALPGLSALGYVVAMLFLKRSLTAGCSQAQVNLAANLAPGLLFQFFWLAAGPVDWSRLWMPATTAATFLLGQIFTFRALRAGEVSVATPLLGTKVLLTAVFSAVLFRQALALQWWAGAAASTFGVILVTGAAWGTLRARLLQADALYSLAAAATFALTDVLVGHWAKAFDPAGFVPLMFGLVAAASFFVFPPNRRTLVAPRGAFGPLVIGSVLLGVQALGMFYALALHESATAVNVVYSSRAMWSVVLAWLLARVLDGAERHDSPVVLRRRLLGSALIFAAVIVVLR